MLNDDNIKPNQNIIDEEKMRKIFRVTEAMRSRDRLTAALAWAESGISVLALHGVSGGKCDCGSPNCQSPGKHPISAEFPHGHLDATRDEKRIERTFSKYPNANFGIVPDADFVVVDVDGSLGERSIKNIIIPETPSTRTGRGRHLFFRKTRQQRLKKLPGVDFRLHGKGYVVASPSRHASGRSYRLSDEIDILAALPDDFYESRQTTVDFSKADKTIVKGSRNSFLTSTAGALRFRGVSGRAVQAALLAINDAMCKPPLKKYEVRTIARSIGQYPGGSERVFGTMADVVEEDVKWLYKPYIPRGAVTLIDGDPGLGKSNFTLAVAAAVSEGRAVPWSEDRPKGKALLMSAEDDPARVQKPRLVANQANPDEIRYARELFSLDDRGLALLRTEMIEHRPDLVIIDPIIAYMSASFDLHKATDMTRFFTNIDVIAKEFDCAIIVVRHLRKSRDGDPLYQGLGSVAVVGRVRSLLVLGKHPEDPNLRAIAHSKSSYAKAGPAIVFDLKSSGKKMPAVNWLGTEEIAPADLLRGPTENTVGRPPKESEEVERFLRTFLGQGEKDSASVFRSAETRGFSAITVRRTFKKLGGQKHQVGRQFFWRLPDADEEEE